MRPFAAGAETEPSHRFFTGTVWIRGEASVVLGLAAAGPVRHGVAAWLLGAALVVYAIAAGAVFSVLRTRGFRVVDDADHLDSVTTTSSSKMSSTP